MRVVNTKAIVCLLFTLLGRYFSVVAVVSKYCAQDLAIQTDGKLVIAGYATVDRVNNFLVARYATDGTLDTTFDTDGSLTTLIGSKCRANALAIQADGDIVVAGWSRESSQTKFALARYNGTDGSLDTSFDTDGKVTTLIGVGSAAHAVAIQSGDQKIVVAGTAVVSGQAVFVVARYNTNGSLDTAGFGGGSGYTTTTIGSWARAHAVAIQADGKIVVAGVTRMSGVHQFAVARYTTAGILDTAFDTDGIVTTAIGSSAAAYGIAIQSGDQKIVVAGESDSSFALARYTTAGALDTTFDTDGKVTTTIQSGARAGGRSVAIQSDGDIVVAGWIHKTRAHSHGDDAIVIARYTSAGALDTAFDTDGIVKKHIWNRTRAHAVAIQSGDQFIVVAGWADNDVAVTRYNTTGSLDTANFGTFIDAPVSDPGGITTLPAGSDVLPGAETFIWDEKISGAVGGTFEQNSWEKRDLNAIAGRQGNVSLDSTNSEFTLQPGQYLIDVSAPAYRVKEHQIQLYNVTDAVVVKAGSSEYIKSEDAVTRSMLQYHFFAHKATTFEVTHYAQDDRDADGFGLPVDSGDPEVYTQVKIIQIS